MKAFIRGIGLATWFFCSFREPWEVTDFLNSLPTQSAESAKITSFYGFTGIQLYVVYYNADSPVDIND